MPRRVVVPRLNEGSTAAAPATTTRMFDPPAFAGLRFVFGVGGPGGEAPDVHTFKPTYVVAIPVFSMGGLDPDGVYEFDAGLLLDAIRRRALRRHWGVRVEIELTQSAESAAIADVWVHGPAKKDDEDDSGLVVLGSTGKGTLLPGGGRTIIVATTPAHDSKRAAALSGIYNVQLRDTDPDSEDKPNVASLVRGIQVDLTRFEFEG